MKSLKASIFAGCWHKTDSYVFGIMVVLDLEKWHHSLLVVVRCPRAGTNFIRLTSVKLLINCLHETEDKTITLSGGVAEIHPETGAPSE